MSEPQKRFTFVELVVLLIVIAVLFSIGVPAIIQPGPKSPLTKALSNAKQIGLACQTYAVDNNGEYPGSVVVNGTTSTTEVSDYSNTAFNLLFPTYLTTIQIFYQPKSAWTPTKLPDPSMADMEAGKSLPAGSNEWAYVVGLTTSTPTYPMIADGFADLKNHAYTTDETARGGVWKGYNEVVVFCDTSAKVMRCDPSTHVIPGSPNGADLFDTSGQPGWMNSAGPNGQHVLNPK